MEDVLKAMWELNIPMLVNHNEVAPSQHELSPIFALTNVRPRSRARGSRADASAPRRPSSRRPFSPHRRAAAPSRAAAARRRRRR